MDHATAPLPSWLDDCWQRLGRGVADRRAPARHPTLATVGRDGGGKARTVVLRSANRVQGLLQVHTDLVSSKAAELAAVPAATLHVWDARAQLQIRAEVEVALRAGAAAAADWARVPAGAQIVYGGNPTPGSALESPTAHRPGRDPGRFCVLDCHLARLDLLWLGREGHKRAVFTRAAQWEGQWIAP